LQNVLVVQVECDNFPLAGIVLANQFDIVANAVDSHIACHGKGFEDIDLFVGNGESSRTTDFANDGYFIVDHAHSDNGCFTELRFELVLDILLGFSLGKSP